MHPYIHASIHVVGLLQKVAFGLVALWPYINKFGNWPVGAHTYDTGVDEHKLVCYHKLHQWCTV